MATKNAENKKNVAIEYSLKATKTDFESIQIMYSRDAVDFARKFYFDDILIYESVFIILMNKAGKTIGWAKISQGGISASVVDIKIILKYVIDTFASGVILVHNHPSGSLSPSLQDEKMTDRLKTALAAIDSQLLDSIILTENNYYSMNDEGRI